MRGVDRSSLSVLVHLVFEAFPSTDWFLFTSNGPVESTNLK